MKAQMPNFLTNDIITNSRTNVYEILFKFSIVGLISPVLITGLKRIDVFGYFAK